MNATRLVVFENASLLPDAWRTTGAAASVRAFNPGLLRDGAGWLLAYRIVAGPEAQRRIGICRLDVAFNVVAGSALPLSDWFQFPTPGAYPAQALHWFADPRLYRLAGRLFVYWNSGWHEPQNHQFLQELDASTLRPLGAPREMRLRGNRQKLEKNWTLFEAGGLFAIYTVNPHRVLTFSVEGGGPIEFADIGPAIPNGGGFAQLHGGLRGGAPPQRLGERFYSFCHSIEQGAEGYRYVASAYRFEATPPFRPTDMPTGPLPIAIPDHARRALPKLNPAVSDVLYPAGVAWHAGAWALSLGLDDERCAIAVLAPAVVEETLAPAG